MRLQLGLCSLLDETRGSDQYPPGPFRRSDAARVGSWTPDSGPRSTPARRTEVVTSLGLSLVTGLLRGWVDRDADAVAMGRFEGCRSSSPSVRKTCMCPHRAALPACPSSPIPSTTATFSSPRVDGSACIARGSTYRPCWPARDWASVIALWCAFLSFDGEGSAAFSRSSACRSLEPCAMGESARPA